MKRNENTSEIRRLSGSKDTEVSVLSSPATGNLFYPYIIDAADDTFIGLTIDVLNKNDFKEQSFYNEKLVNPDRDRQYLPSAKDKWGFIEASNPNNTLRNISNAFCFSGQRIRFYIGVKDQDTGYFDNQFVYCKTQLSVSAVDLVNGSEIALKSFNDFELSEDDSNRYFSWDVDAYSSSLYGSHGMFGMYVLKLDVSRTFYYDSEYKNPINNGLYTYQNQGLLQLLVYSAPREAKVVDSSTISWLKDKAFDSDAAIEDIFSHTLVSDLEDPNLLLTDSQKRAIVADQIAFLFIAQHPTLTADYFPSKIVGLGVNPTIRSEVVIQKIKTYSRKYPDTIDIAKNRLFSILATYQKYNFISDIESCFDDYTQSLQNLRDPVRTLFIDRNGTLKPQFGTNGILYNPYVISTTEADLALDVVLETTEKILFNKCDVDIDNINVTNIDGTPIDPDTQWALVSFSVVNGDNEISRIRYTLWTSNNLNMFEYVDENGTSRYHAFDCESFGNVFFTVNPESGTDSETSEGWGTGEIVFIRIDIEDKNGFVKSFYGEKFLSDQHWKPGFTTIEVFQRQDGSGMVDIYYDYFGTSEINNSKIDVYVSKDNGSTWTTVAASQLRGDFGVAVMPGRNHIAWSPTVESFGDYALVKIILYDINKRNNRGKDSNTAVIRFDRPVVALRKLTKEEELDMEDGTTSSSSLYSLSSISSSSKDSSSSSSSSVFDEWIPKGFASSWFAVAMSDDGRIQTATAYGGQIHVSYDYGETWNAKDSSRSWWGIAMSDDGKIQSATVYGGQVYVSYDYGDTWNPQSATKNWGYIDMSADGKMQTVLEDNGNLYVSYDYGHNWVPKDSSRLWFDVAMSTDGQIQMATVYSGPIGLYISTDYGNTWNAANVNMLCAGCAMSADGQIQIVNSIYPIMGLYISYDCGKNWELKYNLPNVAYEISMSTDGRIQTAVVENEQIYMSFDYGNTWNVRGILAGWTGVSMSADGKIQTAVASGIQIYVNRNE